MSIFVNMAIEDGWSLYGGISIAVDERNNYHFAQALIRETSIDENRCKND